MSETDWADEAAYNWLQPVGLLGNKLAVSLAAMLRKVARDKQYEQWCDDQHIWARENERLRRTLEETHCDCAPRSHHDDNPECALAEAHAALIAKPEVVRADGMVYDESGVLIGPEKK